MGQILPFAHPDNAFDPETTAVLAIAYEQAIGTLSDGGYPELVREIIARKILAFAAKGERDPARLCTLALAALGVAE